MNKQVTLTPDNAAAYVQVVQKFAVLNDEATVYEKPSWSSPGKSGRQAFSGAHFTVMIPRMKDGQPLVEHGTVVHDVYGSAIDEWLGMHTLVAPNLWVKHTPVLAVQLTEETPVLTWIKRGDEKHLEASTTAPAGHWLVQQPRGEQQAIAPQQFAMLYRLKSEFDREHGKQS